MGMSCRQHPIDAGRMQGGLASRTAGDRPPAFAASVDVTDADKCLRRQWSEETRPSPHRPSSTARTFALIDHRIGVNRRSFGHP
jgi:hypothetical protein